MKFNRQIGFAGPHEQLVLLGGSVSDWLVLVVGVVLAGACTAVFAL